MKKWLLCLLLFPAPLFAQYTTTVSGNVKTISPNLPPNTIGSYVEFTLVNCGNNTPTVSGQAVLQSGPVDFFADGTGAITAAANSGIQPMLYGNDAIICGGSQTSRYSLRFFIGGIAQGPAKFYYVASNVPFNLSTAQPILLLPPLVYPNTSSCPAGSYQSGVNRDLSAQCRNLPAGAVNAVVTNPVATQEIGPQPLILDGDLTGQNVTLAGDVSAACPIIKDATHFCISKFNGSNQGTVATTVAATFSPGNTTQVGNCSTFLPNQGVLIAGAGASSGNYVGTVVSCVSSTLTVSPATSTTVSTGAVVQHDESAAFQAAVTSLASTGGTVYLPDGWYLLNGPRQDTAHANAIIDLPNLNYGAAASPAPEIRFVGFTRPSTEVNAGAILWSAIPSGNVFGAYNPGSPAQFIGFTNYFLDFENITFRAPHNPGMVMMNLNFAVATRIDHVRCDTGTNGDSPLPTNTASGCLYMPTYGNNVTLRVTDLAVSGYANALWAHEHADITGLIEAENINGLIADSGPGGALDGPNTIRVGYYWCQICTNQLAAGATPQTVEIDTMDIESVGAFGINDPSNFLHGTVKYLVNGFGGVSTPTNPSVNGAANLCLHNMKNPGYSQNCYPNAGTPTVALGSASGSGGGVSATLQTGSNDGGGSLVLVTGASGTAANATMATFTLDINRRKFASMMMEPANLAAAGLAVWLTDTGNQVIVLNSGSVAPAANTTYIWNYSIQGGLN